MKEVVPNGGAAAAGIKEGDIIKKVEGIEIYDSPDLQEKIGRLSPGDKVQLSVLRDGQLKNISVTLKGDDSLGAAVKPALAGKPTGNTISKLGASLSPASAELKSKFGLKSGVVVTGIEPGKAFDSLDIPKGLVITTVNGKPVNSVKDVEAALPISKNGMTTISGVGQNGNNYTFSF